MHDQFVVIMAGGIGSRFWPQSRTAFPKQFIDILGTGRTLIQMTYDRVQPFCPIENIYVVTSDDYVEIVQQQLPALKRQQILSEPQRRNTAPCVAYACDKIAALNAEARILVTPSDHLITNEAEFQRVMQQCLDFVGRHDLLVTLGIKPTRPSTGYGYIQFNDTVLENDFYRVKTFTEKPSLEIAKEFLRSGDFLWNSGMFIWRVGTILAALHQYLPEVMDVFRDGRAAYNTDDEKAFIRNAYSQVTNISIDYGVMEKADNVYTLPANFGWSDIGSWDSLYDVMEKDYLQNAVAGKMVRIYESSGNMISVPAEKMVVLKGLEGYCVIDTKDVLLICPRDKEQEIKQITLDLKMQNHDRFL